MSDVNIYDEDTTDFSSIGMCGRLCETVCDFEEEANGLSELTLEHPIDEEGRFLLLRPGRILKAVVPVRNVPELDDETQEIVTTVERWYIRADATRLQRTVYNKRDDQVRSQQDSLRDRQAAEKAAADG